MGDAHRDNGDDSGYEHHELPTSGRALTGVAVSATLQCLTGCAIGEIAGMAIGTALGISNLATVVLSILLAFVFGYGLTSLPLLRAGLALSAVIPIALASDSVKRGCAGPGRAYRRYPSASGGRRGALASGRRRRSESGVGHDRRSSARATRRPHPPAAAPAPATIHGRTAAQPAPRGRAPSGARARARRRELAAPARAALNAARSSRRWAYSSWADAPRLLIGAVPAI